MSSVPLAATGSPAAKTLVERLPAGHVVRTMMLEHERILAFLDRLDDLIEHLRDAVGTPEARVVCDRIQAIAQDLLAAEPHHLREEQVLFPLIESRGLVGPPSVMRREHELLRDLKHELDARARDRVPDSERIAECAGSLATMLRGHIAKENDILYPMALSLLRDAATWEFMRERCTEIGPCSWSRDLF